MPIEESPGINMKTLEKKKHRNLSESISISNTDSNVSNVTNVSQTTIESSMDRKSFNLKLQGVVQIAVWLQSQRAVTSFLPLDNRWTALIRVFLGTIENVCNDFTNLTNYFRSDKDSFMEHQLGLAIAVTMFLKHDEYHSKLLFN